MLVPDVAHGLELHGVSCGSSLEKTTKGSHKNRPYGLDGRQTGTFVHIFLAELSRKSHPPMAGGPASQLSPSPTGAGASITMRGNRRSNCGSRGMRPFSGAWLVAKAGLGAC